MHELKLQSTMSYCFQEKWYIYIHAFVYLKKMNGSLRCPPRKEDTWSLQELNTAFLHIRFRLTILGQQRPLNHSYVKISHRAEWLDSRG